MPVVAAILAIAAAIWGAVYARRGSLIAGCGLVVLVSYVLGSNYWYTRIGPLPLTLDRLMLVGLVAALAIRWRAGQLVLRQFTAVDWTLAALLLLFVTSAFFSGQPEVTDGVTSKWGRLLASFIIPTTLFLVIRHAPLSQREIRWLLTGMTLLGVYLALTALFEVSGQWSLVLPRYIKNPDLGIHFGRARGPELNSVSLGAYLTASICCAWTLLRLTPRRWLQLAIAATMPLMAAGVYFTYTRSTWLGLAACGFVIAAIEIPRRWRFPAITMAGLCGILILATTWSHLVDIKREGSVGDAEHSVDQRKSFAYVSWKMFREYPVFGVGFGRFYDRKLPYLSDRSQDFELESIRGLHHHNTFLSVLTETGLVGITAFLTMLGVWAASAWQLLRSSNLPRVSRAFGILMLALMTNYLCSALFHDLTLLPSQQLLLFAGAGLMINLRQQAHGDVPARSRRALVDVAAIRAALRAPWQLNPAAPAGSHSRPAANVASVRERQDATATPSAINLFGMKINRITMRDAVRQVLDWCDQPVGTPCRFIVTPNVDHAVMFQHCADLRAAYDAAAIVLADGAPIIMASRLLGQQLPERVAGSDLVPKILQSATAPLKVFFLGAAPGVAERAAVRIERENRNIRVVGCYSPRMGFEQDAAENDRILAMIAAARPDLLIVGLGAPKQELWVYQHRRQLQAKVAICAGATIDFLAGNRERSPVWMRRAGLEWLHRLAGEPRRLAARYARDAWFFPQLVWREWRANT